MPLYICQRTFTSYTTHRMFCIGQEITGWEYEGLRLTERGNFQIDANNITQAPVFNPPIYTEKYFSHDTDLI